MGHIPNKLIHAINSDTHTLFLSMLILNSQCVGVAIEGMDIWYTGLITLSELFKFKIHSLSSKILKIPEFNLSISKESIKVVSSFIFHDPTSKILIFNWFTRYWCVTYIDMLLAVK